MIQIQSQITNLYISFQILGFGKYKFNKAQIQLKYKQSIKGLSRIINLILQIYQIWIINIYFNWQGTNIIYLDGQFKINKIIQICEIYQIVQVSFIQFFLGKDYTIQISKRPEIFLMILTNQIAQFQLFNSNDFIITIISWEQMNLTQYQLITMQGNTNTGIAQSAGIKYFQQSAQTTAFMLMGITQIYNKTGNLNYEIQISFLYIINNSNFDINNYILYLGFIMILITIMFKLGASPFHFWAPDLYDSLPLPILNYLYIIPKLGVQIFMYILMPILNHIITFTFINIFAIFSIIIGSLGLSSQWKIKRFMTYSAISHIGFILFAFISSSWDYFFYYIFIYGISNLLLFQIFININNHLKGNDDDFIYIKEINGLFQMNPSLTLILSLIFFSQAGIPPLIGFFLKFQILLGIIENFKIHQTFIIIFASIVSTLNYIYLIKNFNFNFNPYTYNHEISNLKFNVFILKFLDILSNKSSIFKPNISNLFNSFFKFFDVKLNYGLISEIFINNYLIINIKFINSYILSQLFLFQFFLFFKFNILNIMIVSLSLTILFL